MSCVPKTEESGSISVSNALEPIFRSFKNAFGEKRSYKVASAHPPDIELTKDGDFEARGLHPLEASALQRCAEETGWDIYLRGAHPSRLIHLAKERSAYGPARPKLPGIYQKTMKDGEFAGLVAFASGERDKWEADIERVGDLFGLRLHVDDNIILRDEWGNAFYSDLDIHVVFRRDGDDAFSVVPMAVWLPVLTAAVEATGLYGPHQLAAGTPIEPDVFGVLPYLPFRHGGHAEWGERNSEKSGPNRGPIPGEICFTPNGTPCYYGTSPRTHEDFKARGQGRIYDDESWNIARNRARTEHYTRKISPPDPRRFDALIAQSSSNAESLEHR